jgi:hypothetical protein
MSWLDFIGNIGNKIKYANAPQIQPLQMAENGGIDAQKTLELALAQPKTLGERLGGRTVNVDFESSNPETGEIEVNRVSKYQPGLLNDIRSGARENFATGFAAPNWEQTITPDGRKKGLGYRFGEGLGSFARFAESPLGRGLIMAGIVGASGGSGLEALGYGAGAGLGNQQARMKDKMYRNELEKMGFDTTGITGYVGDDTFNKIYQSKQLQDNAEYRNALLKGQQKDNEVNTQLALAKLEQEKVNNATKNALEQQKLNLERLKIENEGKEGQNKGDMVFSQLQLLEDAFNNMPQSKAKVGQKGKAILTGATNLVGLRNDDVTAYEAIRNPLVTTLARSIAGEKGVLTDRDFARAEKMVPTSFDSPEQAQAKFEQIRKLVGVSLGGSTPQAGNTTKSGVKYEVID